MTRDPGTEDPSAEAASRRVVALAVSLGLCLLAIRTAILGAQPVVAGPLDRGLGVLAASLQDWLLVLCFLAASLLALRIAPAAAGRWVAATIVSVALLILGLGLANIEAVKFLGGPVTRTWVEMSGVSESSYMTGSLLRLLTLTVVAVSLFAVLALVGLTWGLDRLLGRLRIGLPALCLLAVMPAILAAAADQAADPAIPSGKRQNAVLALAASYILPGDDDVVPDQLPLAIPAGAAPPDKRAFAGVRDTTLPRPPDPESAIRNLVLVVLESTGVRAVGLYPHSVGATPNLDRYAAEMGLTVSDVYAQAPSSPFSQASLIAGLEPDLWAKSMTYDRDDLVIEGLATLMKRRVARAGYFDSSDKRFHNSGGFALSAGYDFTRDLYDWDCELGQEQYEDAQGRALDKAHDRCTVNAAIDWIASEPDTPFFATIWTGMAHYPYMAGSDPQPIVEDPDRNAYLNSVRETDTALAALVEFLRDAGLLDTTLIVVVGDHGEAFGEHGLHGHATGLWDENLRVPLVFLNPRLFAGGQRADLLAGLVDVAPTIADLFGLAPPAGWHGTSLFADNRPDGLFFFSPWGSLQIGFRQGDRKFIFNASTDEALLYDLAADPLETVNLAETDPGALALARNDLAAWVAWQSTYRSMAGAGGPAAPPVGGAIDITIRASGTSYQSWPWMRLYLDGQKVTNIEVRNALSNAEAAVSDEDLRASFEDYTVRADAPPCPRQIEIEFLNDEWAGRDKTGDTDLFIERVTVAGIPYNTNRFRLVTESAGGDHYGLYRMWRSGRFAIDLALPPACLAQTVAPD